MAKLFLSRLKKKFGFSNVSGSNYRSLMKDIIENGSMNVARAIGRLSKNHWEQSLKKLGKKQKQFILPDVSEVLPKRSVFTRKAAQSGNYITDTLRDRLTKNLRDSLQEFKTAVTDEPAFIRRRGTMAGTVNPKIIADFQQRIKETFEGYTKKDPKFKVPGNIKTIAVTEMRSTIDEIKETYNREFVKRNPEVEMEVEWIQNKALAKKPRESHAMMHRKRIKLGEKFAVPLIVNGKNLGVTMMARPHDPSAPLEQIIGCNCEAKYYARI